MTSLNLSALFFAPRNDSFWELYNHKKSFSFERIDVPWWRASIGENWALAFYCSGIYLVTIFVLQRYVMKSRSSFDLRTPLIFWNGALAILSIMGCLRMAPAIFEAISTKGFYGSICVRDRIEAHVCFWWAMFAVSKFIELGDTLFIVLRKRPLRILQWYHHTITLIAVWTSAPEGEPIGLYFAGMNYFVHALMYPYFCLKMTGVKVPKWIAYLVTTLQFAQMVIALLLSAFTIGVIVSGHHCFRTPVSIWASVALFGSFVVLFGNLFRKSVLQNTSREKQK